MMVDRYKMSYIRKKKWSTLFKRISKWENWKSVFQIPWKKKSGHHILNWYVYAFRKIVLIITKKNLEYTKTWLKKTYMYDLLQINNLKRPYTYIFFQPSLNILEIFFHYYQDYSSESIGISIQDMVTAFIYLTFYFLYFN